MERSFDQHAERHSVRTVLSANTEAELTMTHRAQLDISVVLTWVRTRVSDLLRYPELELADLDQLHSGLAELTAEVGTAARQQRLEREWGYQPQKFPTAGR